MEYYTVFWFRRDLRLEDNAGLYAALTSGHKVLPIFIFDTEIIHKLPSKDARIEMIHAALGKMTNAMKGNRCNVGMYLGKPKAAFESLIKKYAIKKVVTNRDYEPYASERDGQIADLLKENDIAFETHKDQVIFEKSEVTKDDGLPYKVYTPYSRKWLKRFDQEGLQYYPSENHLNQLAEVFQPEVSLQELGFEPSSIEQPQYRFDESIIRTYEATRNFPALDNTSKTGAHLRFGTLSIRKMVKKAAAEENITFLKELIWREFFMQILWHFPHTPKQCFKPQYERIQWRNNEEEFKRWCEGNTGYPFVDAGMRELNATGFMHNRVRMLVGSFLCKHLLIDWRWGEAYFAEKLLDYEMSSNVGNWQWVAGCGVDAAPYFRIFNPTDQIKKFDKQHRYIQKWVPNYQDTNYAPPIVEHKFARERCLKTYKEALNG
ncbi:MAG: cryptochrome/photolyase family protein [Flavobacteriaceae bacterium]